MPFWSNALLLTLAAAAVPQLPYQPGRLSTAEMEKLVKQPIAKVRAGTPAVGATLLDAALRALPAGDPRTPLLRADMEQSFGVLVFIAGQDADEPALMKSALPYLKRSIDDYRCALGEAHPEVATALQSWADALLQTVVDSDAPDVRAEAQAAYCEAFQIRFKALGPANEETGAALAAPASVAPRGSAARDRGDHLYGTAAVSDAVAAAGREPVANLLEMLRRAVEANMRSRDDAYRQLSRDPKMVAICGHAAGERT